MVDEEAGLRHRNSAKSKEDPLLPAKNRSLHGKQATKKGKKGLCSLCTCKLLGNPLIWLQPVAFGDVFKRAVGAARGNEQAKEHCLRVLEAWILVGALLIGLFIALLEAGMGTGIGGHKQTLFDQMHGYSCIFGAAMSLSGPVVMSSVLYLCISSVDVRNFDLFFATARSFMAFNETLTWCMCFDCFFCLALQPYIHFTDRDLLFEHAKPHNFLNGLVFAYISMLLIIVLVICVIWHINSIVIATLHAGLLTSQRIDNDTVWDGSHESHDRVVNLVVRRALEYQDEEKLLRYLVAQRGTDAAESMTGDTAGGPGCKDVDYDKFNQEGRGVLKDHFDHQESRPTDSTGPE